MPAEEWTVSAKLVGDFLIRKEHVSATAPLTEGLRQLSIYPEVDSDGKWTGLHNFEAVLSFEKSADGQVEPHDVYERAERLVDRVTALAALGIGRPVKVSGGVSAKRRISETPPTYRCTTRATETGSFTTPTPFPAQLLALHIDRRMDRVIRWWARGISTRDTVDQLVSLNNALDLISGAVEGAPGRVRRCKSCGEEVTIGPGLRERVVYFLTGVGYTEVQAEEIYESRLDLAHARSDLEEKDLRRYREHSDLVAAAVRTGIARELSVVLPTIPKTLPLDLPSAMFIYEYKENEKDRRCPPS